MTPRRWGALGVAGVAALWAAGLHAPFVYDDKVEVIGNPTIRIFTDFRAILLYNVSRPLLIATYALNWAVGGLDPVGYHALSIAIHVVNVVLAAQLVRLVLERARVPRAEGLAWMTAVLWGAHPMAVQCVTYTTGRSDALCATFWLAASLAWLRGNARWTVAAVAAAVMTKELAVMLPLWLVVLRRPRGREWAVPAALVGMLLIGGALRVRLMGSPFLPPQRSYLVQAWAQGEVTLRYLGLWLVPLRQAVLHDPALIGNRLGIGGALTALMGVATLASAWALRARPPALVATGWMLVVCWLAPSGVLPLKELMAEHRAYLVGLPVLTAACVALDRIGRRAWVAALVAAAAASLVQIHTWNDEVRLWAAAARAYPESPLTAYGEADALRFAGRWADAEAGYRRALALDPDHEDAAVNLGIVLAEQGRTDEARTAWQGVITRNKRSCSAHNNLGALAARSGQRAEAMTEYTSALHWCPGDPVALVSLGDLFWERGETASARACYQQYLDALPHGAEADRVRQRLGSG